MARVAQIMSTLGQDKENNTSQEYSDQADNGNEYDGDEIDDDLVFSTIPQRSTKATNQQIHFEEIDDEEMRRAAECLEQESNDTPLEQNEEESGENLSDEQLCQDYATKLQTPTKSVQTETNKRKKRCIEDLDALLNDQPSESYNYKTRSSSDEQSMSPVFKKKL